MSLGWAHRNSPDVHTAAPPLALNGSQAGAGAIGLDLKASGSTVAGLIVDSFSGGGVLIDGGANNSISGDYIGVNATGFTGLGNARYGVLVSAGAAMNTVGGLIAGGRDILSGNGASGIEISSGATGNVVEGDYIGTDASGTKPLGNVSEGLNGIQSDGSPQSNTILGNAIFGNGNLGIAEAPGAGATLEIPPVLQQCRGRRAEDHRHGNRPVSGTSVFSAAVTAPSATPVGVDIHRQPSNTFVRRAIAPVVKVVVVDAFGHPFRRANPWVRISVLNGPAGARLLGRTRVRAVHGVATFRSLKLTEPGSYTLTATSLGLTPDISITFIVAPHR